MHLTPARLFPIRLTLSVLLLGAALTHPVAMRAAEPGADSGVRSLSLDACVATALQNNHRRPASQFAVAAAEAQLQQALSGYWPQARLLATYQRTDEAPNFIFPSSMMGLPSQTITTSPSTALITIPAGVLGPTALQLPVAVPAQSITTPAQAMPIPAQTIRLANPDNVSGSIALSWLVFDGGMRSGLRTQAESLVAAMKQEARRTDLEITDSVTRMYYGAVLARQLSQLGHDTLERMDATLRVTESLYQGGGGKVAKTDFLENKVMVESLRAIVAALEQNQALTEAALANTMGMPWQASVRPEATEIPFVPVAADLGALVGEAYEFSPDWLRLEAGLRAADGAVETARSGHAPKIALTGNLHRWWNSYDAGMATAANKEGWVAGIGMELPLFDGFLTRQKVAEARARLAVLKEQKVLLREGLGLQIKQAVLGLAATQQAFQATRDAAAAATENRELHIRAYQSDLIETEKVIRAQLTEAFMSAQHFKMRYDHVVLQSQLAVLVGTEVARQLRRP